MSAIRCRRGKLMLPRRLMLPTAASRGLAGGSASACLTICAILAFCFTSRAASTAAERQSAIDAGVKYLLSKQDEQGAWTEGVQGDQVVGQTALAGLALVNCGQSLQSPSIRKAAEYLQTAKCNSTYGVALRAAFFSQLPLGVRKDRLEADSRWLIAAGIDRNNAKGMYTYSPVLNDAMGGDYSNSQYAVLGVWYAALAGAPVPNDYWARVERAWQTGQSRDGGWGYRPGDGPYNSMTAAGIATLYITYDYLYLQTAGNQKERGAAHEHLLNGMDWLSQNFSVNNNQSRGSWFHYYMLFGFERVAEASGWTRFGQFRWFDEAADYILQTQRDDGSWPGERMIPPICNTSYALLVLSRGRAPVSLQKLQFGQRWNNRPRDAAQLARWIGKQTERHLNWQIVSADAEVSDLCESPILYLASDAPLDLNDEQIARLKTFIERGGVLLCVNEPAAEPPQAAFADSVQAMGKKIFPAYQFRGLPPEHLIYTVNFPAANAAREIDSMSNGVRELIVIVRSDDLPTKWQRGPADDRLSQFGLVGNLHLYMTDRTNARYKGEDPWVDRDTAVDAKTKIEIARLKHNGTFDPEPAGWRRLANILHNNDQIDLTPQIVDAGQLDHRFAVAHLTSSDNFTFTQPQLESIRKYIDAGGLLIIDAAGGAPTATLACEDAIAALYPSAKLTFVPPDHPIYTGAGFGGRKIDAVQYRRYANGKMPKTDRPMLRGVTINNRLSIIYSAQDLSSGLVGHSVDGIIGYAPASAVELMGNITRWAATKR